MPSLLTMEAQPAEQVELFAAIDYFAGTQQARVDQAPSATPAETIDVAFDDWIFPKSGVAFVWVLADEVATNKHRLTRHRMSVT